VPYQTVFRRYEIKYIITAEQKQKLLAAMEPYMEPDRFGHTGIRNLYYDTDSFRLVRRSIEHPVYKEKLRIRRYGGEETAFVELKKKYGGVVYKRRLAMPLPQAVEWLSGKSGGGGDSQIAREIDYFLRYYGSLHPAAVLSYERDAYAARDSSDFRMTFDDCILARQEALSLEDGPWGTHLLRQDAVLMEVKSGGGLPLWLVRTLSAEKIYKTSFSKYGTAYQTVICPELKGGALYV